MPNHGAQGELLVTGRAEPVGRARRDAGGGCHSAARRGAKPNPLLLAALQYYRPNTVLSILAEEDDPCSLCTAVEAMPGAQVVLATSEGLCAALDPPEDAAAFRQAFDVVHVDRPAVGALEWLLPLVSVHGVLVADCRHESARLKDEAADLADCRDLIAIFQWDKIAISAVDIVALLGLAGTASTNDYSMTPAYSAAFGSA